MIMANRSSNRVLVPAARDTLDKFKYEVANEIGVNYNTAYKGDILARDNGRVGGNMVKKMIAQYENSLIGK